MTRAGDSSHSDVGEHSLSALYLHGIDDDLKVIGCFALTELGYGNNAVEMETTATWDAKTKEFVINSPSVLSRELCSLSWFLSY